MSAERSGVLLLSELLDDPLTDPVNIAAEITAATTAALCVLSAAGEEGIPPAKKKRVEGEKGRALHFLADPEFVNRFRMKRSTVSVSETIQSYTVITIQVNIYFQVSLDL